MKQHYKKTSFSSWISKATGLKKRTKLKLHLLTDIGILISEKDVRGGICHSISQYEKVNNKYMKYYDKDKEASYIQYWDVNN